MIGLMILQVNFFMRRVDIAADHNFFASGMHFITHFQQRSVEIQLERHPAVVPAPVREVDIVTDKEPLTTAFKTEMTQTREEIGTIIDTWKDAQQVVANAIIREGDEIIAHSMITKNAEGNRAFMTAISIYKEGKEDLRSDVFKYLVNKIKELGIPRLDFTITTDFFDAEGFYTEQGVNFVDGHRFELKL